MKKNGFTLVELLAVIAILAILVTIATINVIKYIKESSEQAKIMSIQNLEDSAVTYAVEKLFIPNDCAVDYIVDEDHPLNLPSSCEKQEATVSFLIDNGYFQDDATNFDRNDTVLIYKYKRKKEIAECGTKTTDDCYHFDTRAFFGGKMTSGTGGGSSSGAVATIQSKVGDELVDDETTDHNLRYIGANPNNYVYYNCSTTNKEEMNASTCEKWRIIGVMNNIKTSGGQTKTLLKIIRSESLGGYSWDSSESGVNNGRGINQWGQSTYVNGTPYEGADLMRELNYDYLGKTEGAVGSQWYNGSTNKSKPSSTLNIAAQGMIEEVKWPLGSPNNGPYIESNSTELIAPYVYAHERADTNGKKCTSETYCNDNVNRTSTWTGKVGLIYPSDYLYATKGGSTPETNRTSCLNTSMSNWNAYCSNNDWLKPELGVVSSWTMSPAVNSYLAYSVFFIGVGAVTSCNAFASYVGVSPVVFLKSDISITGGDGSSTNPYTLG